MCDVKKVRLLCQVTKTRKHYVLFQIHNMNEKNLDGKIFPSKTFHPKSYFRLFRNIVMCYNAAEIDLENISDRKE